MAKGVPIQARLGWRPDLKDQRDFMFSATRGQKAVLPASYTMRGRLTPPVLDQLDLGACTGETAREGYAICRNRMGKPYEPSPLFAYYMARQIEGNVNYDAGATLRDVVKGLANYGVCSEKLWPYVTAKFKAKPPAAAIKEALAHQGLTYLRIDNTRIADIKVRLTQDCPVLIGFSVYDSFEFIGKSGLMPLPKIGESLLGGHAVTIVGYDDSAGEFTVQNHWSKNWGDRGFFYMPYTFATNPKYASDFWTLQTVE